MSHEIAASTRPRRWKLVAADGSEIASDLDSREARLTLFRLMYGVTPAVRGHDAEALARPVAAPAAARRDLPLAA